MIEHILSIVFLLTIVFLLLGAISWLVFVHCLHQIGRKKSIPYGVTELKLNGGNPWYVDMSNPHTINRKFAKQHFHTKLMRRCFDNAFPGPASLVYFFGSDYKKLGDFDERDMVRIISSADLRKVMDGGDIDNTPFHFLVPMSSLTSLR